MLANWMLEAGHAAAQQPTQTQLPDLGMLATFLQFGVVGLVVICLLIRKWLVPEWTLRQTEERMTAANQDLAARLAETRQQLDRLQDVFQGQMIPALTRATEINARYNEELQRRRYEAGTKRDPKPPESEPNE